MISGPLFAFLAALALSGGQLEARVVRSEELITGPSLPGNHPSEAPLLVDGVVSDSGLDAAKVINQPMHEVNIDQHNAFALPLADALAFCGAINELTLLHRQAFETLEAQGVSHREAVKVLNDPEVKKQLGEIAETRHEILDAQLNAEEKFTQQETELVQKAAELAPEADAFALLESGAVSDFLAEENAPLEQKIAFEKLCGDYAQIQEERKQTQERLGYQCISAANCAYKKAAQLAVWHPNAAQAVFAAIGWLTETLEHYARIEGAVLGATLGSATGLWGTAAGIAGGMALMEGATKAFAGAVDESIQLVKNYATQLAKTEAEAAEFGQAVEGFAGAGVLAFSARAGRRWLGKRRAVKMASVAIEKAPKPALVKDALSERAVIKDGKVFLEERELGAVSSMPTTRTFAKPLDAALREEFQSGVFGREVAWKCNVDGRTYRIIKRNDIDPHRVVPGGKYAGKTNLDLMKNGLAPYNNTGQKVVLHHVNQKASGPFIETTRSVHTFELHGLFGPNKSHPTEPVHRGDFNKLREAYWRDYAESIK